MSGDPTNNPRRAAPKAFQIVRTRHGAVQQNWFKPPKPARQVFFVQRTINLKRSSSDKRRDQNGQFSEDIPVTCWFSD
ncbi:MAG: hypothetical protein B7Z67_04070 [Acidiphilium sp. 21-60-14]|nr:MAG: hypothetical protein B7Z67_04070 [Acidiphilium sp. 21-60-14]OYV91221.1 MAG: hypothetical protein B7Z57_06225 [Acidiphilium sp. 37-60-79]OZB39841.1 MAG: hypothetical protein B7X48_07200 [Acidiphilium sp. 34-60-192]